MTKIKYTQEFVRERIAQKTAELMEAGVLNKDAVYLVVLTGGVWFAMHLFDNIPEMNNEVHFIKCHSYEGKERGEIVWDYLPNINLEGREVVILDDICDSGNTTRALANFLKNKVTKLSVVTLLRRSSSYVNDEVPLYSCIVDDSNDFFYGCGLDDNDAKRMLPYLGVM